MSRPTVALTGSQASEQLRDIQARFAAVACAAFDVCVTARTFATGPATITGATPEQREIIVSVLAANGIEVQS